MTIDLELQKLSWAQLPKGNAVLITRTVEAMLDGTKYTCSDNKYISYNPRSKGYTIISRGSWQCLLSSGLFTKVKTTGSDYELKLNGKHYMVRNLMLAKAPIKRHGVHSTPTTGAAHLTSYAASLYAELLHNTEARIIVETFQNIYLKQGKFTKKVTMNSYQLLTRTGLIKIAPEFGQYLAHVHTVDTKKKPSRVFVDTPVMPRLTTLSIEGLPKPSGKIAEHFEQEGTLGEVLKKLGYDKLKVAVTEISESLRSGDNFVKLRLV